MFLRVIFGLLIWFLLIRNIQTVHVPNIYEWMEKNAYICEIFNPSKSINEPVFLMAKEAKEFTCDEICGNPAQTELACGRIFNEQSSEDPNCFEIPKICIQEYVREFPSTLQEFVSTTKNIGNIVEFVDEFTESKFQKENFTNFTNNVETKTNIILTTLNSTNLAGKTETISSTTKLSTLFTTTPSSSSTLTLLTTNSSTSLPKTFSTVQSSSSSSTLQSASTATTTSSTPTTATSFSSTSNVSSTLTTVFPTTSTTQQLFKNLEVITSTSPASTSAQVSTTTTTQALPTTSLSSSTLTSPSTTTLSTSTTTTRVFSNTSSISSTSPSTTTPLTTFTTQKPLKNAETTTLMINTLPASKSASVTTGSSSTTTIISTSPTTSLITPISSTTLTLPTTTTTTMLSPPKTSKISTETTTTNTTTTTTSPIISTISRKSIETTTRLTTFTTQKLSENPKTTVVLSTLSPTTTTSSATTPQPTTRIIFSAAKKINSTISTVPTIISTTATTTTISLSSLSKPSSTILNQFTTKSLQSSKNELSPTMTSQLPITTSSTTFITQNSTKNSKILPMTAVVSSTTPQSSTTTIFLNKSSSASTSSIITTILTKLFPTSTLKAIPNNNGSANTQSIMHLIGFTLPTAKNSTTQSSDADLIINSTSTLISSTIVSTTTESLTEKQILPDSTLQNITFATTNPTFSFGISSSTSSSNLLNKQLTPVNKTSEVPISTEVPTESSTLFISKIPSPFSFEKKNSSSLVNSASTSSTINKINVLKTITANPPSKTTRKSNNVVVTGFLNGRLSMASAVEFQDVSKHLFKPKIFPNLIRKPFPTTHGFSETEKKFEFELKKVEETLKRFRISTTSPQTVDHRETKSTTIEKKMTTLLPKRIRIDDQTTIPAIFLTNRLINSPTTPRFAMVDGEASREHFTFEKLPPSEFNLTTKKSEFSQKLKEKPRKKFFFRNRFSGETVLAPEPHECVDGDPACEFWANNGECAVNPRYMLLICRISCKVCQPFN